MGLGIGALSMVAFACFILYGGLMYFVLIAMGRDPIKLLPEPLRGFLKVPNQRYATVLIISVILLIPAFGSEGVEGGDSGGGGGGGWTPGDLLAETQSDSGNLGVDESEDLVMTVEDGYVLNAVFTLTWEDEPDQAGMENEGDTFSLNVTSPDLWSQQEQDTNSHGNEGEIILEFYYQGTPIGGDWNVTITLEETGHQMDILLGIAGFTDNSNDWELSVEFEYYL